MNIKKITAALTLFILDGLAMFLFERFPAFFFPAYRNLSAKWLTFLSGLTAFVPFSIWDIAAVLLILLTISTLIYALRHRKFISWLSNTFLLISVLCFVAVFGWLLNHYAPPLYSEIGLNVDQYSKDQLEAACDHYLNRAAETAVLMIRDEEGHVRDYDFSEIAQIAGASYERISQEYPVFKGSNERIKRFSLIGDYLMYNGIVGMFMPLSGEASVPYHVPTVPMPFHMAHEAAHRLGIASEQEANFAAFLACVNSQDLRFIYSAYYSAFSYCFSSLYQTDPEAAVSLYERYSEDQGVLLLRLDRSDAAAVYKRYESSLQEISDQINDTYLKTFSQEEGIRSYGMVTDYLIAYYLKSVQQ